MTVNLLSCSPGTRCHWRSRSYSIVGSILSDYGRTYVVDGWRIESNTDGTNFRNVRTGHGMFVSIENVYGF